MQYAPFQPPSGFFDDGTNYSAKGRWFRGDKVRFKEGFPQKLNGWTRVIGVFLGICRNLKAWIDLSRKVQLGIGTNLKYYVATNGVIEDITPLRATHNLGANPFTTVGIGSKVITVTDAAHGASVGDFVTFAAAAGAFGGVTATDLNDNWQISNITGANTYQFVGPTVATSVASGGGAAPVTAAYEIHVTPADQDTAGGFGTGDYGENAYGVPSAFFSSAIPLGLWSSATFGQDLIINQRGAGIYYWVANSGRALDISTLAGASDTPTVCNWVLVSPADRTVFAFGVNAIGSGTIDPLLIRWTTTESAANWTPSVTDSSGELRLSSGGSSIYTAQIARGQILVWTDSSLHALLYVGGDLGYGQQIIAPNIDILGPNAAVSVGDFAIWMGSNNFYIYDGSVRSMPCSIRQAVFGNINLDQSFKVFAGSNSIHREIWFFYPSASSIENDSYAVYNYHEQCWYYGTMARTAWYDQSGAAHVHYPQAAGTDGYIYFHEFGLDDGSTSPPTAMDSYIESGPLEIGEGDKFVFMRRIIPDITFTSSQILSPDATYTVEARNWPGGPFYNPDGGLVVKTASMSVEQFTPNLDVRLRGREYIFRVESNQQVGVMWRLGVNRFEIQPDGER